MPKKNFYAKDKKPKQTRIWGYPKERDYILENVALLISAGIGIAESVSIVSEGLKSKVLKKILTKVVSSLDDGVPFWKSLDSVGLFADNYINLIKVSEQSGRMVESLKMIVLQQQKERTLKSKVRLAMMYPIIVSGLIVIIGLGISWFILPKLMTAFSGMNVKIPLVTRVMMDFGVFLQNYGYIFVPSFIFGLFLTFYIFFVNKNTRFIGQNILIRTPVARDIIKQTEISRMGFVLSSLLNSGMPVIDSLESLIKTSTYSKYTNLYKFIYSKVNDGFSFKNSLSLFKGSTKLIPLPIQQMIIAGEKSGNLPGVLGKVSQIYEEKVDTSTANLAIILEPILLIIVFLGVLAIALAVILPIYSMIGNIGG
jgi:type II secretory pathway component PulF